MNIDKGLVVATRCHDIQASLGRKEVPEFEVLPKIGMLIRLSIHLRGLPPVKYEIAKQVAYYYLDIPSTQFKELVVTLAEIEFIRIDKEGDTIISILPSVPYFDDIYTQVGEYSKTVSMNEMEKLAIYILEKLSNSPNDRSNLFSIGAEAKGIKRSLQIGEEGGYIIQGRARGKDIIYSPLFFIENADLYLDATAKSGSNSIKKVLELLRQNQGWPLALVMQTSEICGTKLSADEVLLLKRLAQDGAIKPPAITTSHHGENYFLFTPTPGYSKLHPGKKNIYEKATALVAAVRQGQLLPREYAIRNPYALLRSLKETKFLRATTEANEQYRALLPLRIGYLRETTSGYHQFRLHDTPENQEALEIAIQLVAEGTATGTEVNEEARIALQKDQSYIEALIASRKIRESEKIALSEDMQMQIDDLLLIGGR
ncbi:MAG: hypothetical protein VB115_04825 [Christensenellaceae bacterium]|nr:hypothetical protein [Christensenellaceae bacterium]